MPTEAPAWYAGTAKTSFPEAPPSSLLLLGHVALRVPDVEAVRLFYVDVLGGIPGHQGEEFEVTAGLAKIRLVPAASSSIPAAWPGHLYFWVADIQRTLDACRSLEKRLSSNLVQEVHHITSSDAVDAILLRDPSQQHTILVNQAPKGLAHRMRMGAAKAARVNDPATSEEVSPSNLLGLLEVMRVVAAGTAVPLAKFYSHFLLAAVSNTDRGWAVHFSVGKALNQTLLFVEDEAMPNPALPIDHPVAEEREDADSYEMCMYLPSKDTFRRSFTRCSDEGLTQYTWPEAEQACEFCFAK